MCIVLFRVLPLPLFPSFLPQTTENASLPGTRPPGLWVPVSPTPAEPCERKVQNTLCNRARLLHLDEIYRSVPAMPPGAEQKARLQIWGTHFPRTIFTFQSWPLAPGPG